MRCLLRRVPSTRAGLLALGVVLATATGCSNVATPAAQESTSAQPLETAVPVEAATVHRADIAAAAAATGEVQAWQHVQLASQIEGAVRAVEAEVGQRVRRDQVLVELDCRLLRAELAEAEAALARSEREAARTRKLADAGLGEQRRLEAAAAQEQIDRARVDRLRTQAGFCQLASPFTGVVIARHAYPGDLARPGTTLLTIADVSRLRVLFPLPERDAASIRVGASVPVTVDATGAIVDGRVTRIWPVSDSTTHRTPVEVELRAAWPSVKPGYMVRARVPTAERSAVLVMDRRALLPGDVTEVFVVDGGVARRRRVRLGVQTPSLVEIHDGLEEGHQVVIRGAERLSDGSPVRVEDRR